MYETVDNAASVAFALPPSVRDRFAELARTIAARSLIVWGEHCSECAYPTCYTSCAFYTPRRDGHCRRFIDGIERGTSGDTTLGKILLGKWAKLEGTGPVKLVSTKAAMRRERIDRAVSSLIVDSAVAKPVYARSQRYWNRYKAVPFSSDRNRIDGFVVEAYLPSGPFLPLTVTLVPADEKQDGLFQSRIDLQPGYNRAVLPYSEIAARVDLTRRFLIQIEPVGEAIGREVVFGLIDFVRFSAQPPREVSGERPAPQSATPKSGKKTRTAKCVVWDLDDTIWRGTLAEGGAESLVLDPVALSTIVALDQRGILQSVASKNDPETAMAALEAFNIRDYFLFPQIGWDPKSAAVKRIAELLDIGLDTFVFVDDQAFERGEVGETLPDVTVLPASDIPTLLTSPLFDLPATPEGAKRRAMYQTEERRHATFAAADIDYVSFLRDCRIRLEIFDLADEHRERAYELSQRTNQLNVSGTKYSRDEIAALLDPSSKSQTYLLRCEDRFGDYGIVGMCVVDQRQARIESFMMSCRVQRKRVEQSFFAWLSHKLSGAHARGAIEVSYRRTERNQAIVTMLEQLGFVYRAGEGTSGTFARPIGLPIAEDDVVEVIDRTTARLGIERITFQQN